MRLKYWLSFVLLIAMAVVFARSTVASKDAQVDYGKIEAGLLDKTINAETSDVVIEIAGQADLSAAYTIADWTARGEYVVDTLQSAARTSQKNVMAYLEGQTKVGSASNVQSFWIANVILATVDAETLVGLSSYSEVLQIREQQLYEVPPVAVLPDSGPAAIEWGVDLINAPDIWANLGTTGEGVVVMNNDTGVLTTHAALRDQYRGWDGIGFDHDYNFYDPSNSCGGSPCDNNGHGTHTMGTMVGDDGGANQIGVAPGAKWIAGKGCESFFCSDASLLGVAEWALAPCPWGVAPGNPSCDADMRPNVINNSWGGGGGNPWYQPSVDAWQASGIIPVFSAGNSGPGAGTIGSPGDYCNVLGVGATTIADGIASFSSRGPGNFMDCEDKPDVSAPGENVRSAYNNGGYTNLSGTSMAAPHVAGCIALMKSIDPSLDYDRAYDLLTTTGVDLGTPGFDYSFGYGRIDCFAAASELEPDFRVNVDPESANSCAGGTVNTTVNVLSLAGFSDPVTLDDGAATGAFGTNPVVPPGSSSYSLSTAGYAAGAHIITITGSSTTPDQSADFTVNVFNAAPGAPTLDAPANGATDVALIPTFTWTPGVQSATYDIGVYSSPAMTLGSLVDYALGLTDTSWSPNVVLDPLTTYYWGVRAKNPCGFKTVSAAYSFTTRDIPPVLLVDDDDNSPDVRFIYEDTLDANAIAYDVWDTANSDNEPDAAFMGQYRMVIWFTGDEFGGFAGPSGASEDELASYLDAGGHCLWIASQDYLWDRGGSGADILTPFMMDYLGTESATSDVSQSYVWGQMPRFLTAPLNFPYTNYSDRISPDGTALLAYLGDQGDAAIYKLGDNWVSMWWGFGLESFGGGMDKKTEMMGRMVQTCYGHTTLP